MAKVTPHGARFALVSDQGPEVVGDPVGTGGVPRRTEGCPEESQTPGRTGDEKQRWPVDFDGLLFFPLGECEEAPKD